MTWLASRSIAAALLFAAMPASAAPQSSWKVECRGKDVTLDAGPMQQGSQVVVNLSALAAGLNLRVAFGRGSASITSALGETWTIQAGATLVESRAGNIVLQSPVVFDGASLYLPVSAIERISGIACAVDTPAKPAAPSQPVISATPVPEGWEPLTIAKSPTELAETARVSGMQPGDRALSSLTVVSPPRFDNLRFQWGQGYVQGADAGSELMGSGRIAGLDVSFSSLLTEGPRGIDIQNGRLIVGNRERGWEVQGGDLFSDIWGLARGLRYSAPTFHNHHFSTSLYLNTQSAGPFDAGRTRVSFSDEYTPFRFFAIGGEVTSDQSYFARSRIQTRRVSVYGYYRRARGLLGEGVGALGSLNIWRGISVQARFTRDGSGENRVDWKSASLRVPIYRRVDLTLEYTLLEARSNVQKIESAALSIPFKSVRMLLRYQRRDADPIAIRDPAFLIFQDPTRSSLEFVPGLSFRQDEVISSLSYFANRRLSFDIQAATRWRRDGVLEDWEQMIVTYRLSRKTDLQFVGAVPNVLKPEQMRVRVSRQVRKDLLVAVDYGNVPSYQGLDRRMDDRVFRVFVRKDWDIATRGAGAEVAGVVRDGLGQPVPSTIVQVGNFSAATGVDGRYRISNLPSGSYEVKIDEKSVAADYLNDPTVHFFSARKGRKLAYDFTVSTLDTIRGHVYVDENVNGQRDKLEGLAKIPVRMGDRITATIEGGVFAFFNVPPGEYVIHIDAANLPSDLVLDSEPRIAVKLDAGQPVTNLGFRLKKKVKPIQFQEVEGS